MYSIEIQGFGRLRMPYESDDALKIYYGNSNFEPEGGNNGVLLRYRHWILTEAKKRIVQFLKYEGVLLGHLDDLEKFVKKHGVNNLHIWLISPSRRERVLNEAE